MLKKILATLGCFAICVIPPVSGLAQNFDLHEAQKGWLKFEKNIRSGFDCELEDTFEKSGDRGNSWTAISKKNSHVSIGPSGEYFSKSTGEMLLRNRSYVAELLKPTNSSNEFSLSKCFPSSEYSVLKDIDFHREVACILECICVEYVLLDGFFQSPATKIIQQKSGDLGGRQTLEIEIEIDQFQLDELNRLSGRGTIILFPNDGWLLKSYRLPMQSVANLPQHKAETNIQLKWSETAWVNQEITYDFEGKFPTPRLLETTYESIPNFDWRRHHREFTSRSFVVDDKRFFLKFYGIREPPFVETRNYLSYLLSGVVIFGLIMVLFFWSKKNRN